jgi:ribosomal protein S18 acetylase RimI-like enzyme
VVLGGVEVDVVGDLDRQVHRHVVQGVHRLVRDLPGHPFGDLPADRHPPVVALRHEVVQAGAGEDVVAEQDGEVVGYTYAGVEGFDYMALRGPAGVLYDIVVDPTRRGQGVGRALLDATIAELAARGAPRVVLSTAQRNEAAQRLFAAAGFRPTMIEMTRELG